MIIMSVRGKNEGMLSQKGHDWDSRVNELGKEAAVYNTTHWESLLRLSLLGKLRVYLPTAYIRQSLSYPEVKKLTRPVG